MVVVGRKINRSVRPIPTYSMICLQAIPALSSPASCGVGHPTTDTCVISPWHMRDKPTSGMTGLGRQSARRNERGDEDEGLIKFVNSRRYALGLR